MRLAPALALACLILPGIAQAAVVSYSAPAAGAGSAMSNTIPDFAPSLGMLERVQLRLTGAISDYFTGWYKQSPNYGWPNDGYYGHHPEFTTSEHTATPVVWVASHGAELLGEAVTVIISDWGGSYAGGYSTTIDSVADLPLELFGRSPDGKTGYTLISASFLDYATSPWSSASRPKFQGTATVTYTYTPVGVPEPTSFAVFAFGLAGYMVARWHVAGAAACRRGSM